jgi:tyrosyl-tRNA synthetase
MVYNSEWLSKMNFEEVINLASKYTVARMIERDDFTKRFKGGDPISVHEFLYPLAQAMDSVAIKSDVELGGTDQKFNLLVGRDIQREYGMEPQCILTMPLIVGTDGVEKMSKSYDNYIGISDSPKEIYGRTLSIPDDLIYVYYDLASDVSKDELAEIKKQLDDLNVNPRDIKRRLARTFVTMYHDKHAAKKDIPDDIPEVKVKGKEIGILDLLLEVKYANSKGEAKRLVNQGGVSIDGNKVDDMSLLVKLKDGMVLKVGKRKFVKLIN